MHFQFIINYRLLFHSVSKILLGTLQIVAVLTLASLWLPLHIPSRLYALLDYAMAFFILYMRQELPTRRTLCIIKIQQRSISEGKSSKIDRR